MSALSRRALATVLLAICARPVRADDAAPDGDVDSDAPAASLTSSELARASLDARLHLRSTDLLRDVPGLAVLEHGRGGLADQLLVRGLDAGQGADLSIVVDGIPVNAGGHALGHGYADTHFVIADTLAAVALHVGDYAARLDPYATAGQLELRTIDRVPGGAVVRLSSATEVTTTELGQRLLHLGYRLVGMASPELARGSALLAVEVGVDDGPYTHPQRYRRGAVLAKWKHPAGPGALTAAVQLYAGRWFDAGVLPAGALADGTLHRFGAVDPDQGGLTRRASASLAYDAAGWHAGAYVVASRSQLYLDDTLFLADPDRGDQREATDRQVALGLDGVYRRAHRLGGRRAVLRAGVAVRSEHGTTALWHTARRTRLEQLAASAPALDDLGLYAEERIALAPRVTLLGGVRLDELLWSVDDGRSGERAPIAPSAGVLVRGELVDLAALAGAGTHATDPRAAAATSGYGAFRRTLDAELDARLHPDPRLTATAALWWGQTARSAVWLPGTAEAILAPEVRRRGLDLQLAFQPRSWFGLDAALAVARGPAALAPRLTGSAGLTARSTMTLGALRLRGLGARATGDPRLPAAGYAVVDLIARRRWGGLELGLAIENLLDTSWREVQIVGDVRLARDADARRELLVTPGVPRTVMVTIGYAPEGPGQRSAVTNSGR